MNLPTRAFRARSEHPIQIIRRMLRRRIGTNVPSAETILNGQQIHTTLTSQAQIKHITNGRRWPGTRLFTENSLNYSNCRA